MDYKVRLVLSDRVLTKKLEIESESSARDIFLGVTLALSASTHSQWRVELFCDDQLVMDEDEGDFSPWSDV